MKKPFLFFLLLVLLPVKSFSEDIEICRNIYNEDTNIGYFCNGRLWEENKLEAQNICMKYGSILNESKFSNYGKGMIIYSCVLPIKKPINLNSRKTGDNKLSLEPPVKNSVINLESAKTKCKELGYKNKTEKFGNCVLELTK